MTIQLVRGDAAHLPLPDSSVDLIVTSPPYFALRSYQDAGSHYAGQIGSEATPAEFVDALIACTAEWVRVLKPCGSLWVNLGDKYAGGQAESNWSTAPLDGGRGRLPELTANQATAARVTFGGIKPKSLMGLPWRYALRCIDDLGLILRAEIIWLKPNGLPESVTDRVRRSHEQWFHFVLRPRYYAAVDTIREAQTNPNDSGRNAFGQRWAVGAEGGLSADDGRQRWGERQLNPLGKLPGSVWSIPSQPLTVPPELGVDHFAAFPMEWPRRIIQGWSPSGICTVCGEGRRPVAAKEGARPVARAHRHLPGYADPAGQGMRDMSYTITGETCSCGTAAGDNRGGVAGSSCRQADLGTGSVGSTPVTLPPTRPAVVLDPFGGTGTTALMADVLGRHGVSVDMSADYCRLAKWRTTDPGQRAAAMQVEKPEPVPDGQTTIFDML